MYQSKECVKLVAEAYIELLSSDRSLLVPILGSLADLPLDAADKSAVLDATEVILLVYIRIASIYLILTASLTSIYDCFLLCSAYWMPLWRKMCLQSCRACCPW